jgi:hypothetical protein
MVPGLASDRVRSDRTWTRILVVCLGLFGVAFAVTGLLVGLPSPAAGGTCGPGQGSEAAIVALFDPGTIGAGPEPAATNQAARAQWTAFVQECQTAADDRGAATFAILIVSIAIVFFGAVVIGRSTRRRQRGYAGETGATNPPFLTP